MMKLEQSYKTGLHVVHFFNVTSLIFLMGYLLWRTKTIAALFCFKLLLDLLRFVSTEICLTQNKLIYKKGFLRCKIFEFDCSKLESVSVEQSILARILDYGTIRINEKKRFKHIRQPFELKCRLQALDEKYRKPETGVSG